MTKPDNEAFDPTPSQSVKDRVARLKCLIASGRVKRNVDHIVFREPTEGEKATAAKLGERAQRFHSRRESDGTEF